MKPGYKQTEIGVIPEDWGVGSLKEAFLRIDAGTSVNSDEKAESRYFVLKTSAVRKGHVNIKEAKPVIASDYPRLKCPIKKGAIIISRMNTPSMVGECGFSTVDAPNTFLPDRLWQIEALSAEYDFQWLNYLLNTEKYNAAVRATATGTSNSMKNIAKERLLEIAIPKPLVQEQHHIAEAISDIDELIASLENLIKKKKAIKQGAMQQLLTGKIRFPGFNGEWKRINLMKNSKIKARIGWQGLKKSEYLEDGYAILITGTDFENGKICWGRCHYVDKGRYDLDPNIQVNNDDLLITKDGSLGKTAIVRELSKPATLNSGIFLIRPIKESYDSCYVYYVLTSFVFLDFLEKLSAGSTIVHLYQKDINKFEFMIPPTKEEQAEIANVLSSIDNDIDQLEKRLHKCESLKQGMMQQLLTGKLRLSKGG